MIYLPKRTVLQSPVVAPAPVGGVSDTGETASQVTSSEDEGTEAHSAVPLRPLLRHYDAALAVASPAHLVDVPKSLLRPVSSINST